MHSNLAVTRDSSLQSGGGSFFLLKHNLSWFGSTLTCNGQNENVGMKKDKFSLQLCIKDEWMVLT